MRRTGAGRAILYKQRAGGIPAWTATANPAVVDHAFATTSVTFASQPVNNPATGNVIIVKVANKERQTTGVTVDGNAMTLVVESGTGNRNASIWKYTGATFTTPNIVVTSALAIGIIGITVGYLSNVNAAQTSTAVKVFAFNANPQVASTELVVPATGRGLAIIAGEPHATNITFNVGTEDYTASITDWRLESGYYTATATPSFDGLASGGYAIASAAWGP